MGKTLDNRLAYADFLRVAATFAVIILHCTGGWLEASAVGGANFTVLNVFNSLVRWCVPMFIMLSGMFFLDPKKSVTLPALFFKYILRIAVALAVWGTLYALWDYRPLTGGLSLTWLWGTLKQVLLGGTHYHLWFLYMLIGLYLVTPILRAFVKGASRRDLHYFLVLTFLAAFLLPTLLALRPSQTVSTYFSRLNLGMLTGYVGYFVAGYYLKTYTLGRIAEFTLYALGILGGGITIMGTALLSGQKGGLDATLYGYTTPNVAFMAVAIFVLFRYLLGVSDERSRRQSLSALSRVTFGIYLVHDFFLILIKGLGLAQPVGLSPAVAVPLMAAGIFAASFVVSWLLSKIPFVGKYLT